MVYYVKKKKIHALAITTSVTICTTKRMHYLSHMENAIKKEKKTMPITVFGHLASKNMK